MQYKSQFIKAFFRPVYEDISVEVPTGEIQKSFFGSDKPVMRRELRQKKIGCVEGEIDLARLAEDIEVACNNLASQSYEIVNIATINASKEKITTTHLTYSAMDVGELIAKDAKYAELSSNVALNYTEGVIITARKIQ